MVTIENELITVVINDQGAELDRIYHKQFSLDYLWNADPAYWAKKSPVLFPIVGGLKNNQYSYEDKAYQLGRHGFARESLFTMVEHSASGAAFELKANETTRAVYPFDFSFRILYSLQGSSLSVCYRVRNEGSERMYFSVGGHPAFRLPLEPALAYHDYYLEFSELEYAGRWPLTKEGLIKASSVPLMEGTRKLPLKKELFAEDALVFKKLASTSVRLKSDLAAHGLDFDFEGFPYLGVWAAQNADFLCIEPWCGIADDELTNQQLKEKEGVETLEAGGLFERTWTISLF